MGRVYRRLIRPRRAPTLTLGRIRPTDYVASSTFSALWKGSEVTVMARRPAEVLLAMLAVAYGTFAARADETCMSPYMPKITGQEDYVYVWTLGIDGVGDGSDKLVTIGANPGHAELRQGRLVDLGRRPARGAPRRLHRRPPLLLGRRARRQQDLRLRRRRRPGAAEAGEDHRHVRRRTAAAWSGRTPSSRCPGRMLITGALQRQGQRRQDRHRRVQQRRQVRPDDVDAGGRRSTATTCACSRASTACSRRRSPATTTTCATSASCSATRRR